MATSSLLGGNTTPSQPSGTDVESLGPSNTSDSGSDVQGALGLEELLSDSDSSGTGERASIDSQDGLSGADILPDHVELGPDTPDVAADMVADEDQPPEADGASGPALDVERLSADEEGIEGTGADDEDDAAA